MASRFGRPPPWCDILEHSEATKEYWAEWDLLGLSGAPLQEKDSESWTYTVAALILPLALWTKV